MKNSSGTLEFPPCQQSTLDSSSAMKKNRAFEFTILSLLLLGALYIFVATPSSFKPLLSSPRSQCNCSTTDTDILWLRNPFSILSPNETFDFQIACDNYQGNKPCAVNNGLAIVRSNNKTISLYDTWYEKRKVYVGKNEQAVVEYLIRDDSDSDSNSCDDEFGLVRLFGDQKPYVELPPSGSPRAYSWSDDDSGCDDDHTVPVEKSDAFDVCNTYRMDISKKTRCLDYDMFSQVAVEEYNRRFKVLMALSHPCNLIVLYLTFEAKDLADGGTIKIYQAVVWWTVGDVKVESFRLKPPEDEQGYVGFVPPPSNEESDDYDEES
ncbi:hypothetical protein C3L33_03014, partial [Rhododendron williamsianum]